MGFFDRFKSKKSEVWRLCITIEYPSPVTSTDRYGDKKSGTLFYHLFESDQGNRKIQARTGLDISQESVDKFAASNDFYNQKIYRWLVGRNDPEIPRFTDIDAEETLHYLKGTISETI